MKDWKQYFVEDDGSPAVRDWNIGIQRRIDHQEKEHGAIEPYLGKGPGTELRKLISWFASNKKGCGCKDRELIMNRWGADECEKRTDEIVGWMMDEGKKRRWPTGKLAEFGARKLVAQAIRTSRGAREPQVDKPDPTQQEDEPEKDCASGSKADESPEMTFVWVYWNGGQGDELRWSIRSVLNNYQGKANIVVAGDKPPWYSGTHINVKRVSKQHRRGFRDVLNKINIVCTGDEVPESFVWMMDDIYFVNPVSFSQLSKHYYHGRQHKHKVSTTKHKNGWGEIKRQSFLEAEQAGLRTFDYCTHLPHILHKKKWIETWEKFNLSERTLQWEILYGAMHFRDPVGFKGFSRRIKSLEGANKLAGGTRKMIINNSNGGWKEPLRAYLWNLFPDSSPVESHDPFPPLWDKAFPVVPR